MVSKEVHIHKSFFRAPKLEPRILHNPNQGACTPAYSQSTYNVAGRFVSVPESSSGDIRRYSYVRKLTGERTQTGLGFRVWDGGFDPTVDDINPALPIVRRIPQFP